MRKRDVDNLNFVLSLSRDDFPEWFETLTEDDRQYCSELLVCHKLDLIDKQLERKGNYSLANKVIDRIKAKI